LTALFCDTSKEQNPNSPKATILEACKTKAWAMQKRCHLREFWMELGKRISTLEAALVPSAAAPTAEDLRTRVTKATGDA
jgi:hypothetical protein